MSSVVFYPYIDPNVEHVGVSRLRKLNATNLRDNQKTLVIQENDTPLAVVLAYEQFLGMQREIQSLQATVELLSDQEEREMLGAGLEQLKQGKTRTLAGIKRSLKIQRSK